MSRQSRFETKTFRGCELRLHAGREGYDAPWLVRLDVYDRTGTKTRLHGRSEGWLNWEAAVIDGFQMGREFVNALLATGDAGQAADAANRSSAMAG